MTGSRMAVLVLMAAAVCAMSAGVGAAATLTVDGDGGADYTSIQAAVDAANAGDMVFVYSGIYHEGINVYSDINLIGENMYNTIIDADNIYDPIYISGTNIQVSGFTVRNGGSDFAAAGIYLFESNNIILSELYITNNSDGIFIYGSNNVTVSDNIVVSNDADGIVILESSNCLIDSNNASLNGDDGIDIQINSYTNIVSNNIVSSNADNGIIIQLDSTGNTVHHNNISANIQEDARDTASSNSWDDGAEGNYYSDHTGIDSDGDGIGDTPYNIPGGSSMDHYPLVEFSGDETPAKPVHNLDTGEDFTTIQAAIDDSDTVNGHTITVDAGTYNERVAINKAISLIGKNKNNTVIDGDGNEVISIYSNNVEVSNFTLQNGDGGITARNSAGGKIFNNIIRFNTGGIGLETSNNFIIFDNYVYNNSQAGIGIWDGSYDSVIYNNTVIQNGFEGIGVGEASYNLTIFDNYVFNNTNTGIGLWGTSNHAVVYNNTLINNSDGNIAIGNLSFDNIIYHNNFLSDFTNALDYNGSNTWDNGYPSGGNYWSDYTGTDSNSDGIGDTPYNIDGGAGAQDRYPLMQPWNWTPAEPTPSVHIRSSHDFMERKYVADGSFPSSPSDLTCRVRLEILADNGQFTVPKVVIFNTSSVNLDRIYYQVDEVSLGRGNIVVFPDHIEWTGNNETVSSEFELGIYELNTHQLTPPFSSSRSVEKEVFDGTGTVKMTFNATPTDNLDYLEITVFAEETDHADSILLEETATNEGFIDESSPEKIRWEFDDSVIGHTYSASVNMTVIPKTDSATRYWAYTRIEGGYGSHTNSTSGSDQSMVEYTDSILGDLKIYFESPVDYCSTDADGEEYYERFKHFSEIVEDGEPHTIGIGGNAYKPGVRTVPVGTTVSWTNREELVHTVTSDTGLWDSGNLSDGQSFSYTFNTTGTYTYHDALHPSVAGVVIVYEKTSYYSEFCPEIEYINHTLGDFVNDEKVIMEERKTVIIWGNPVAPLENMTMCITPITGSAFEGGYYLSTGEHEWWSNLIPNSSVNGTYSFNLPDFTNLEWCEIKLLPAKEKELESGIIVSRTVDRRIFNDSGVQNLIVSVMPMINADWIEIFVIPTNTSDINISAINSSGWEKIFDNEYYICVDNPVISENYSFPLSLQVYPNDGEIEFVPKVIVTYGIGAPKHHIGWTNEVRISDPSIGNASVHTDNQVDWTISTSAEIQKSFHLKQISTLQESLPPFASFSYSPENPIVDQTITFDASSSFDPDGNITKFEWNFGDETNGTGEVVNHSYAAAGSYNVTLTVTDDDGATNSTSLEIGVTDTAPDIGFINTSVNSLYIGDADNDGENEIVVTTGSNITVWEHNPDGTYSQSWSEYIQNVGWGTTAVVVGDVDNDGENEIAVGASSPHDISSGGTVRIYEYSSGTYELAWSATIGEYIEHNGLSIGDADNDGNNELLVGVSWYGRKLLLFKHDAGNIYNQVWNDNLGSDVASTCIGDVDNDGQNEIIAGTGSWSSYDVRIYEHLTGSSYSLAWNNPWSSHRHESVFVGDADNDGLNELLVIRNNPWSDDDDVAIFEHTSGNTYALNWSQTLVQQGGTSHTNAVIGDVDNDGKNEFVIATGDRIIRYNPSNGTYTNAWNDTVNARTVRIEDIDNDGYNELIAGGDRVYIYNFGAAENKPMITLIFEDTFDGSLDNWTLFGQPRPVVRTDMGNPQPCFDNQGDANYDSGGISTTTFNYSDGLIIESDMYINDARYSGCWVGANFGIASSTVLTDTGGIPPAIGITHEAIGPLCWMDPDKQGHGRTRYYIINESGMTESFDILGGHADLDLSSWHTYRIYIRPDRIVEFYKDEGLVYTTKSMVSMAYNDMPIVLGARSHSSYGPALHDNVKVYTVGIDTTPPTLAITSPAPNTTTHSSTITIAGTASDISGIVLVTVNGEPANATLDWSANVTLTEGENTITVIATDGAGLSTTAVVTVRYDPLRGDLNHDGYITPADAAIALEIAAGSRPFDAAADVSGDGQVTSLDALMILQAAAGSIEL